MISKALYLTCVVPYTSCVNHMTLPILPAQS